jgi:translation initiation factor IF-2
MNLKEIGCKDADKMDVAQNVFQEAGIIEIAWLNNQGISNLLQVLIVLADHTGRAV